VTFGVGGMLSCVEADSGKLVWRKNDCPNAWPRFYTSMSPLIADGLCVALVGGSDGGAVAAYDLATGDEKWKWTGEGPGYASPVLMTVGDMKLVVAPMEKSIVAVNLADGTLAWQTPFVPQGRGLNASTPVVDGQTVYYGGTDRGITAVKLSKSDAGVKGETLWNNMDNSLQYNTPVLKDGKLYGLSQQTALFCLNAETGTTAWTQSVEGQQGFGTIVDAGKVLMALTPKTQLIVYAPDDSGYKELTQYKVSENSTYAFPVVSGNRIFVKDEDSVILWTVE
jgi:outer membrane protein assembly factor BamB